MHLSLSARRAWIKISFSSGKFVWLAGSLSARRGVDKIHKKVGEFQGVHFGRSPAREGIG